jgi:small subunit ribosomal protein S6
MPPVTFPLAIAEKKSISYNPFYKNTLSEADIVLNIRRLERMPLYESTLIARQDLSKQDVTKLTDSLSAIVEQGGGKVVKSEYWGLKSLAYRIQKHRKGHYAWLGIDASPSAVKEMQRNIGINEDIVRSLTVRVDELPEGPTSMMQQSRSDSYTPDAEVAVEAVVTDETLN